MLLVIPPNISAAAITILPAGVIGVVPPSIGMGAKQTGNLYFMLSSRTLHDLLSILSGDVVQYTYVITGGSVLIISSLFSAAI